jgi:DNA-binding Xre family transcriptional regulator
MDSLQTIISAIFNRSAALGWSQTELARRASVARESVSRLRSRSDVDFSLLHKLCNALGLQLTTLEGGPLALSFPYNWSNSTMSADKVIAAVLARGIFADVLEVARYYGLERVKQHIDLGAATTEVQRMLCNIEAGFAAASS